MFSSSWHLSLLWLSLLLTPQHAPAAPSVDQQPPGLSMRLSRRRPASRTVEEWGIWAKEHRERLQQKYGGGSGDGIQRRSSGYNLLTNQNADSSYFGSLAIGSPPVSYNVILDTGSADLWVAASNCTQGCSGVATFDPAKSSTYSPLNRSFQISYGSGEASGALGQDTVQMAGFQVKNQTFALADTMSSGLLMSPVSGLLGLAWKSIASSASTPFWESLVANGAWDSPVMAFQFTRFLDIPSASQLEPGGTFTMGSVNSSLYTGEIDYVELATTASYWLLPLNSVTVQGNKISVPSGSSSYSAIDTGTTLVGGPSEFISQIFAQIPGSQAGSGNFKGYWTYPCSTSVNVSLNFGGKDWSISPADFRLTQLSSSTCLGAFFELSTQRSAPSWIVGDTFLKNVYSVFRYNPASVGFAQLSSSALALNGQSGPVPSPTIGSVAATVSATSSLPKQSDSVRISTTPLVAVAIFWATSIVAGLLI